MSEDRADTAPTSVRIRSAWILTSATNLALGLVIFVVSPIVAQILGPEGRGRLTAIQLLPQLLADLSSLGLGFSIIHFGARRPASLAQLLRWAVRPSLLGATITFTIGQVLAGPITGHAAADERLFRAYLLLCPIVAFSSLAIESLRAAGDFKAWNTFVLLRGSIWPTALLIGVVPGEPSIARIVWVHLALAASLLVAAWSMAKRRAGRREVEPDTTRPEYVRYGLQSLASTIPNSANAKLDQVVMSFRVDRDSLGLYSTAVGWSGLTIPVMRGLTGVAMPHVSGATEDQRVHRTRQLISGGLAAVALLTVAGIVATVVLWGPLYGADYRGALKAAVVLIPAALLLEFNAVQGNIVRSLGRPGLVAALESIVLVVSTTALVIALTFSKVFGPALVSLGTYVSASSVYSVTIARLLGVRARQLVDFRLLRPRRARERRTTNR